VRTKLDQEIEQGIQLPVLAHT